MSKGEREALAAVEAALLQYRDAYAAEHPEARIGTLTDWIVIAAEVVPGATPEDDFATYSVVMPGGGIPSYRAAGLLHCGLKYVLDAPEADE